MGPVPDHQRPTHFPQIYVFFGFFGYFQWFLVLSVIRLWFVWLFWFFSMVLSDLSPEGSFLSAALEPLRALKNLGFPNVFYIFPRRVAFTNLTHCQFHNVDSDL